MNEYAVFFRFFENMNRCSWLSLSRNVSQYFASTCALPQQSLLSRLTPAFSMLVPSHNYVRRGKIFVTFNSQRFSDGRSSCTFVFVCLADYVPGKPEKKQRPRQEGDRVFMTRKGLLVNGKLVKGQSFCRFLMWILIL